MRKIRRDRIAGAFDHQGIAWQRRSEIKRVEENVNDSSAAHRIRGGKTEINAIKSLRRSEIQVTRYLGVG